MSGGFTTQAIQTRIPKNNKPTRIINLNIGIAIQATISKIINNKPVKTEVLDISNQSIKYRISLEKSFLQKNTNSQVLYP